ATLDLDLTFGVDLRPEQTSTEAFFLRVNEMIFSSTIETEDLSLDVDIGFLGAEVRDGQLQLTAAIEVEFVDPNGDSRLRISEMQNTPLDQFVRLSPSGMLTA